jgi:hypothetical protein
MISRRNAIRLLNISPFLFVKALANDLSDQEEKGKEKREKKKKGLFSQMHGSVLLFSLSDSLPFRSSLVSFESIIGSQHSLSKMLILLSILQGEERRGSKGSKMRKKWKQDTTLSC